MTAPTSEMARPKAASSTTSKAWRSSQASKTLRIQIPAPSDCNCSPCDCSASCTTWRVRAVATGNTSTAWASTMALKLNNQPRYPKGPERDSSKYTTNPTTTEGTAKAVLSKVSTRPRPANRATPSQAPSTKPRLHASAQAQALTASERPTMARNRGSSETSSCKARNALSEKDCITRLS